MTHETIFNFDSKANISDWVTTNDVVMGGVSTSGIHLNEEGHGVFSGHVSLENNGGFASVRYQFPKITVTPETKIKIRLRGDGKNYKFRIKQDTQNTFSYQSLLTTDNAWQEVVVALKDMYPIFRGQRLEKANFDHDTIAQIVFLIGNKRAEDFKLTIASITLLKQ